MAGAGIEVIHDALAAVNGAAAEERDDGQDVRSARTEPAETE